MDGQTVELSHVQVEKGVKALLQYVEKTAEGKKQSLLSDTHLVNLQFATKKVIREQKTIKLKLPNGLQSQNKEVCLFVKDLDKSDREYEKSVRHFKDFLKSKGISCVSEIIPLKALKLEYKPFEAKRNLSNRFNLFLADARIIHLLPSYLGKAFFGRKRNPIQVRMDAKDLSAEFEAAISNSRCILSGKGSVGMATVGITSMSVAELVQNITASTEQIVTALPGGAQNIRNIYIKTEDSMSIPLYMSQGSVNEVQLPKIKKRKKPVVTGEVTTVPDGLVKVYPTGYIEQIDDLGKVLSRPRKPLRTKKAVKRAGKRGANHTKSISKKKTLSKGKDSAKKPKSKKTKVR